MGTLNETPTLADLLVLRCEDCGAEWEAPPLEVMRQVTNEPPVFHDGCALGRGFGVWRLVVRRVSFEAGEEVNEEHT